MKKLTKAELQREARSLRRYVTDPDLVGWLWPWQHARAIKLIQEVDEAWWAKNADKIVPPEPIKRYEAARLDLELLRPDAELLV